MRLRGLRISKITVGKRKRGTLSRVLDDFVVDDDMRRQLNETALEDIAKLVMSLQRDYGLVAHMGRKPPEFAYHWHDQDGSCHSEDTHDGYENIAEAICGAIEELLSIERLNGMGPLVMALMAAGVDLSQVILALNNEEDDAVKVKELTRALRVAFRSMIEAGRVQPSGFTGPVVASLLAVTREIVHQVGADAHAALGENQLPIPAVLPAGNVAISALSVLLLEQTLGVIDDNNGGATDDDRRSHITSTA